MARINDGGPAFPRTGYWPDTSTAGGEDMHACIASITEAEKGMSLRDWFAGQALVGFQAFVVGGWSGRMPAEMAEHIAANCYAVADAMIAHRERRSA